MSLLQVFSDMNTQRSGFRQNSYVADEQACASGSFEFNKHSVVKIFIINGLNFQCTCNLQAYNLARPSAESKSFCMIVNIPVPGTVSNFQHSIFNT